MSNGDEEATYSPRPGTTAALEQRVARLERQYDTLSTTVQSMSIDVAVTRSKMEGIESAVTGFVVSIAETKIELVKIRVVLAVATGAVGVGVFLMNLFAPAIQRLIGLPS